MGVYADQLASINQELDRTTYEIDAIEGTKSLTIKVYAGDGTTGPSYFPTALSSPPTALIYDWTGTGGIEAMVTAWRTANPTATAEDDSPLHGGMYYTWSKVQDSRFETEMKGTDLASLKLFQTYLTKKKDHYQAIVDNGEDPNGVSVEDMNDIIALAP